MIIGVDAGCLGIRDERLQLGVYQVVFNLLRNLGKLDKKNQYRLYSFHPINKKVMEQFGPNMENIVIKPSFGWLYLSLPVNLLLRKVDLFLGLNQALPVVAFSPSIVLVYDVAFRRFPDCYPGSYEKLERITFFALRKAKKIIAISKATKEDLVDLYNIDPGLIKVIYPAYDKDFFKPQNSKKKEKYFIFVGAFKKTKNIPTLLKAFRGFLNRSNGNFSLLLVGSDFWLDPEINEQIEKLDLKQHVKIKGFLRRAELLGLLSRATAFVSPSLYEGFGITLLEAAGIGCPIIAGKDGATKEVIGKSGMLINPKDEKSITEAMLKLADNKALRSKMRKEALLRAKFFSWDKFARNFLEIISEVGNY